MGKISLNTLSDLFEEYYSIIPREKKCPTCQADILLLFTYQS